MPAYRATSSLVISSESLLNVTCIIVLVNWFLLLSVVEEVGQTDMIDFGAVCVVRKFEVEAFWIEVLHPEMIGPVVEDTLKIFCPSLLKELTE